MSKIGTATTVERVERIDQPGPGEQSPGLVFRVSSCLSVFERIHALTRTTELHVTADGITARGDLGGPRTGILKLPWSRIRELHYAPGGAGEVGGLYAREGSWCSRCLLPRISEPEADQIIADIVAHYPVLQHIAKPDGRELLPERIPQRRPSSSPSPKWKGRWAIQSR